MANSGSFSSNQVAATSKIWYWDLNWWVTGWNGNTASIHYEVISRCTTGGSDRWVANYGFSGSIAGHGFSSGDTFYNGSVIASGDFTLGGGTSFSADLTAHPYSGSYTSSGSGSWTLDNNVVTPTVTCSVTRGLNTIGASMSVTSDGHASIVDRYIDLFTDSGCTHKVGTITGSSGTFTGLTPNTTYYARANASNGYYRGYSSVKSVSTYDIAKISSAPNINHGADLAIGYSNPSGASLQIGIFKTDGSTALAGYRACSGSSYTFTFTEAELDNIYKQYGTGNTLTVRVYIKTANNYLNYKELTITLTGDQRTIRTKVSGTWRRGKLWMKVNGGWHRAVLWKKENGAWHRCI